MNDTSPDVERRQFEMMMSLGANRRVELACEMYMAARESILASLSNELSEQERQRAFVVTMYGKEFSEAFFKDEEK
ncbi:MAG: hypothetical protein ABIU09_10325 [Pyrinomonadaceae bacterium]